MEHSSHFLDQIYTFFSHKKQKKQKKKEKKERKKVFWDFKRKQ